MYILQETPDKGIVFNDNITGTPVATLKDEFGGVSHIIKDDNCYVLVNGSEDSEFRSVKHWFPEAVATIKSLPALA